MGESAKALLVCFVFFSTVGILALWFAEGISPTPTIWVLRLGLIAADVAALRGLLVTLGMLGLGHVHMGSNAQYGFIPPTGVAEDVPPLDNPAIEVLWRPGDPAEPVAGRLRSALT